MIRVFGTHRAYFIPEGGWGDNGVSFSAIQLQDWVKPAALAIMTAESETAGRPFLGEVPLSAPNSYAMRFGARPGESGSGELLVAWTDGLSLPVDLHFSDRRLLTVTHELGATSDERVSGVRRLTLDSDPVYLELHGSGSIVLRPSEPFGPDLLLGGTAVASSAAPSNPASAAIDGIDGANGGGDIPGLPMWESAPGDRERALVVALKSPATIDRLLLGTHSIGSVVPGLRDYNLEIRTTGTGRWRTVARIRNQFYDRHTLIHFPPVQVAQVRVQVLQVEYSGYAEEGVKPTFWPTDSADLTNPGSPWYGPAVISELAAFAPAD